MVVLIFVFVISYFYSLSFFLSPLCFSSHLFGHPIIIAYFIPSTLSLIYVKTF